MTALDVTRSRSGRRLRLRPAHAGALVLLTTIACTGENIFPLGVSGTGGGGGLEAPTVEITQPAADAALVLGDSVQVTASISATNAVNQATMSGSFLSGASAYVQQSVTLSAALDTTVSRFLQPAGTVTGEARIVVQATDVLGNTGADTVFVTVN